MTKALVLASGYSVMHPMQHLVVPFFVNKAGALIVVDIECHPAKVASVTDAHGNTFFGPNRARKKVEKWYCLVAVKSGENTLTITLTEPAQAVVKVWLEE